MHRTLIQMRAVARTVVKWKPDFSIFPCWTILNSSFIYFKEMLNYLFKEIKLLLQKGRVHSLMNMEETLNFSNCLWCAQSVWVWFIEYLSHQWSSVSKRTENKPDPPRWCNIPGILETTPWIPKLFLATWPNSGQCLFLSAQRKCILFCEIWQLPSAPQTIKTDSCWLNILHISENNLSFKYYSLIYFTNYSKLIALRK